VVLTREPGGCTLAEDVRAILLHSEAPLADEAELLLFLAARAQHVEEVIAPALQQGKWVLCDRFHDSTLAYQGFARGLGIESIFPLCEFASRKAAPDKTFLLDLAPHLGMERVHGRGEAKDRLEKAGNSFHEKVREGFLHLASLYPDRIETLNAANNPETVLQEAIGALKELEWIT
jgi:dTMP kinase